MEDRRVKTTFLAVSVLYVWFRRCNADINTLDIEKERTFPTSYATSPYLRDLLESVAEQKISPDTSNFFLNEYDYIIVGAGSAGSVLANRLTEDLAVSVLLLEAGGQPPYLTEVPVISRSFIRSAIDWKYKTVPQKYTGAGLVNREVVWPKGKSLGGSSIFNSMLYVRGNKEDYDDWAKGGATGWSYEEVFPYFLKSESNKNPDIVSNGYISHNRHHVAEHGRIVKVIDLKGSNFGQLEETRRTAKRVYDQVYKRYANKTTYNCVAQVTNPKSRGTVRLQSDNPYDAPLIDPNYFENYDDMLKTIAGMKKWLAIANTDAVQTLGAKTFDSVFPGCESYVGDLNATLECQARSVVLTLSHEVGTCKMGIPEIQQQCLTQD